MSASERAVIYVESGSDLASLAVAASTTTSSTSKSSGRHSSGGSNARNLPDREHSTKMSTTTAVVKTAAATGYGSNYVIKIQIGEENMFNPVRIDVSTGKGGPRVLRQSKGTAAHEDDSALSSSGQSSPRSDMTPPPRINSGAIRFGSETSESDTESDVSSEFRPVQCQAAQFALREICEAGTPSPPPMPRSIMKNPLKAGSSSTNSGFKSAQFLINGKGESTKEIENHGEYTSLVGVRGAPDTRRMKSSSSKSLHMSPECMKAKADLEAEILKRGKLLGAGSVPSSGFVPKKVSAARNKDNKVLSSILENVAQTGPILTTRASNAGAGGKSGESFATKKDPESVLLSEPNGFHLNEINECNTKESVVNDGGSESLSNFAGYRDIFTRNTGANPIMSEKGTIRGVKNRVRDGIATFLQSSDSKVKNQNSPSYLISLILLQIIFSHKKITLIEKINCVIITHE